MSRLNRLLVIATGTANTIRLPELLLSIRSVGPVKLDVLLTASAERIVRPETIAMFCDDLFLETVTETHFSPGHMGLALGHDQVVVMPASLHTLTASALGLGDRLGTEVIHGHPRPCLFFPSMNRHMWSKPSTKRTIQQLQDDGHVVVPPTMIQGYEVASKSMTENPGLPAIDRILAEISRHAAVAVDGDAQSA